MTFINKVMYKKSVQQLLQPDAFFVMKIANAALSQFSRQALRARNHRLSKC